MWRPQSIVLPAAVLGCILVAWIGTIAAVNRPMLKASGTPDGASQVANSSDSRLSSSDVSNPSSPCSLSQQFPGSIRQWCSLIDLYATDKGLPPGLVAAVMLEESGGNPQAFSASGAVGLMQIMPRDGVAASFQCNSGPCFASRPNTDQLLDPGFNISYGTNMLAGLVQKYGSIRDGLLHYGPIDVGYEYADIVMAIWQNYS